MANNSCPKVRNVNGVFHLAGVLDDGIIGGDSTHRVEMGWDGKHILLVVGRRLSYWEGNFSGAMLNYGGEGIH